MSERDCPDERFVLWEEHKERIRRDRLSAHPDCRDPAHPGCSQCAEPARNCENGCNGCEECTDYECSCTDSLRPECDGGGCAAERANEQSIVARYHQLIRDGMAPNNMPTISDDGDLSGKFGPLPEHGWD